jgi:hypothetical protein
MMTKDEFGRRLQGEAAPGRKTAKNLARRLAGKPGPSPVDTLCFGQKLRGEAKPSRAAVRESKRFLEGFTETPPRGKGKRRALPANAPKWPARELTESDRKALVGAGVKCGGRHHLLESVCQPGIEIGNQPEIRGVRIITANSRNRRRYSQEALDQAQAIYENAKVNIDHPSSSPTAPRGVASRFGKLINVRCEDEYGPIADLAYNPKHPLAETVRWFAENMPDAIGLSHNAQGEGYTEPDGTFVVTRILKVRSVDLVCDPATTSGLF